jgi:hypothetical protein
LLDALDRRLAALDDAPAAACARVVAELRRLLDQTLS